MAAKTLADGFAEAMQAYETGRVDAAKRLAKKLADAHPQFGGAHYLLGLVARDRGQAQAARFHLEKAVALNPDQAAPRMALADVLPDDDAVMQVRAVLERYPDHGEAHARLGSWALDRDQNDLAVTHFRQALAQYGDWSAVLNNLGLALGRLGRHPEAVDCARQAVEISPDHVGFRVNWAMALHHAERGDAALEQAERATGDDPANDEAWMALGLIRQTKGDWNGAALAFAQAPQVASARWSLGEILRRLGRLPEAADQYRACLALDAEDRHGARLGLALVTGEQGPERAPQAYVRQLFDDVAHDFDRQLVDGLHYRAPQLLGQALAPLVAGPLDIMDLGCGTGLMGPVLQPWAKCLDGVDLSPAMVDKARERGLYDHVFVGDVLTVSGSYDLAVAADVLVYLGDLEPFMLAMQTLVRPGGLLAFTVERSAGPDWVLGEKSRYAHGASYVQRVTRAAGFDQMVLDEVSTRSESGQPVPGLLMVVLHG